MVAHWSPKLAIEFEALCARHMGMRKVSTEVKANEQPLDAGALPRHLHHAAMTEW